MFIQWIILETNLTTLLSLFLILIFTTSSAAVENRYGRMRHENGTVLRTVLPRPPKYIGMQCLFIYLVCAETKTSNDIYRKEVDNIEYDFQFFKAPHLTGEPSAMFGTVQNCGWQVRQIAAVGLAGGGCMVVNTRARSTYIVSRELVPRLRRPGIWAWSTCSDQKEKREKKKEKKVSRKLDTNVWQKLSVILPPLDDLSNQLHWLIVTVTWHLSIRTSISTYSLQFAPQCFRMCRWNRTLARCVVL